MQYIVEQHLMPSEVLYGSHHDGPIQRYDEYTTYSFRRWLNRNIPPLNLEAPVACGRRSVSRKILSVLLASGRLWILPKSTDLDFFILLVLVETFVQFGMTSDYDLSSATTKREVCIKRMYGNCVRDDNYYCPYICVVGEWSGSYC